jgi:rod shape-determining protein MreC
MRDTRRTRVVLVVLLLTSLTLIALNGNSGPGKALRSGAGAVFGPVQRAAASAFRPVHDFFGGIGKDDQARLDQLQKDNDALRLKLRASQYATCRAGELDALLHIAGLGQYEIKAAQVIAVGPAQGFAWTAEIDAGSLDGLKVGMTVINGDGLVGRIKTVSGSTATVLLTLDPSFNVGARVEATLEFGVVGGQGTDPMQVQMFSGQAILKPGDRLVTDFRTDSTFAAGIPIGQLLTVRGAVGSNDRYATLKPYVDFTALDIVGVIVVNPRTDPRDSVLPPKPTAGATAPTTCGSASVAATATTGSPTSPSP